jgi:hypothetical protein
MNVQQGKMIKKLCLMNMKNVYMIMKKEVIGIATGV